MDWDDLRFVLAAARQPTLTGAAKQLGVNQTTVTRRLQNLEAGVGVRLFDRHSDGLAVTPAGERAIAAAEQMAEMVAALDRQLLGEDTRLTGPLRVATIDMVATYDTALFATFTEKYPGLEVELSVSDKTRNLTKREADIVIRWSNAPTEHLVGRKVARAEFAPYGARSLVTEASNNPADQPWLAWDRSVGALLTDKWMNKHVPAAPIACTFDSALAMHAAVRAGLGLAFMPCGYGDREPDLSRAGPVEPDFAMDIWVLTHADLRRTAKVRAFMDHAADYFEAHRAAFAGEQSSG